MAEIKLYDYTEIIQDDWWGDYEVFYCIGQGKLSASVVVPLIEAVPADETIDVLINSVGGYVFDGWAIYNALKRRTSQVNVRIDGLAASIASIIAMAGDNIVISQAAMLMIHKPTVDLWCYGSMDAEQLKREAATLDSIQAVLNDIYTSKTGLDSETIDSMINVETWIAPSLAVSLGFADSILIVTKDSGTIPQSIPENAFKHLFKNSDSQTKAYANKHIKTFKNEKPKNMDVKETLAANTAAITESKTVLSQVLNYFTNIGKPKNEALNASSDVSDGTKIYYDGVLGVGTEVFSDEEHTEHPTAGDYDLTDGNYITVDDSGLVTVFELKSSDDSEAENVATLTLENTELKAENASLKKQLNAATKEIKNTAEVLNKIKEVKSNYVPAGRETELDKPKPANKNKAKDQETGFTFDEIKERREERKNKKK